MTWQMIHCQFKDDETMKQHTAEELEGHRIRIASPVVIPVPIGRVTRVTDLETGEEITNISAIDLHIVPSEVITAQLTLFQLHLKPIADGGVQAHVTEEKLTVHSPEVAITAIVTQD